MDPIMRKRKMLAVLVLDELNERKRDRRWWVRPIFQQRKKQGAYHSLVQEMRLQDVESFFNFFRMTPQTFDDLLSLVGAGIAKKQTFWRNPISASERLAITLRFLASGDAMKSISYLFRVSPSSLSSIIPEVCEELWQKLQPMVLPTPTAKKWLEISTQMNEQWQFPNCIGALDGKHVVMQAPHSSGSNFYNYKGSFSIVLLGVSDAAYKFTVVDIGQSGHMSDGGVFQKSVFGQCIQNNTLNIPPPMPLRGMEEISTPHVFVADAAFPLKHNIMKPYPGRGIDKDKKIFNYRLSRCRRLIENTFGIMSARFRIFRRPIVAKVESVESIVKATVCLHNYLKMCDDKLPIAKRSYCPFGFTDYEDSQGIFHDGSWRAVGEINGLRNLPNNSSHAHGSDPKAIREHLKMYFNGAGSVSWQLKSIYSQ